MRTEQHRVKITSIVGSEVVFESPLKRRFRLDISRVHRDDGSEANFQDVQVGLEATINIFSDAQNDSATLRFEPIWLKFIQPVNLYSKETFPIAVLKRKFAHATQALEMIEMKCAWLRNCNGAIQSDNYFWRVFSVGYLEHLLRRSTPISELRNLQTYLAEIGPREDSLLFQILSDLEHIKSDEGLRRSWIREQSENTELWRAMEEFVKQICCAFIKNHPTLGMDPENEIRMIYQEHAQVDLVIRVMAEALNLKIIVFHPELTQLKHKYASKEVGTQLAYLYLFNDGDLYHTLYSQAQMDAEHSQIDPSLLYNTVLPRYQLPSRLGVELQETHSKVEKLATFNNGFQEVFYNLINVLRLHPGNNFFDTDLSRHTILMSQDMNRGLSEYRGYLDLNETDPLPETTRNSMDLQWTKGRAFLDFFENEHVLDLARICSLCREPGGFILDCAHVFCRNCIEEATQKQFDQLGVVLMPDGETIEELTCPKLSCFTHISGAKLREIIRKEDFDDKIEASVQTLGKRQCVECLKVRKLDTFNIRCVCGFDVCDYCYCNLCRENEQRCSRCCETFSPGTVEGLRLLYTDCSGCRKVRSLISDFSRIECKDHIICQDCLYLAAEGNKRCPQCHRKFSWEELVEIKRFTEKTCVFCTRKCRQSRINTTCGCVICYQCAKTKTIETGNSNRCFKCNAMLSWEAHSALLVYITPMSVDPDAVENACLICKEVTDEMTKIQLQCQHVYHIECLKDYLKDKIAQGWAEQYIPCFEPGCTNALHHSEVGFILSPDDYLQYQGNITRARSTTCPRCTALLYPEDANGLRRTNLICTQCRFHFCTLCQTQYGVDHDSGRCSFEKTQSALREAERNSDPSDVVSQCPVCKTPFVKREGGEDDVVCVKLECRVRFCVMCCVPTELYRYHGNAWHRQSCPRYNWDDQVREVNMNCKRCVELGRLCDPPNELEVERRFGYNEE